MIAGVDSKATKPPTSARQAAQQFEAVFLRQLIAEMRKAKLGDELFGSQATASFREHADSRLADTLAQSGAFGLAALIERQVAPK